MKNTTPSASLTTAPNAHPHCRHPTKCEKRALNPSESEVSCQELSQLKFKHLSR